jgi:hypothetical protein
MADVWCPVSVGQLRKAEEAARQRQRAEQEKAERQAKERQAMLELEAVSRHSILRSATETRELGIVQGLI